MRISNDRRLGHLGMFYQSRFDFRGTQPVAGYVEDVVDTTGDPVITVFVTACAISGEVIAFIGVK